MDCRLICDAAGSGSWNMSVDEALLETADPQSLAVLRFYTWDSPTLSLGYFQEHAERHTHPASECCSLVRRASGGGAILHHWELTYSYIVPVKSRFSDDPQYLYDTFHDTLIQTLAEWGIVASRHVPVTTIGISSPKTSSEPFLCFERCNGRRDLPTEENLRQRPATREASRFAARQHLASSKSVCTGTSGDLRTNGGVDHLRRVTASLDAPTCRPAWRDVLAFATIVRGTFRVCPRPRK